LWNRLVGAGAVQVVNLPKLDALKERGELLLDQRAVLCFLDGDDVVAVIKVALSRPQGKSYAFSERDTQSLERLSRMPGNGSNVQRIRIEAARLGPPSGALRKGEMVKQQFREAAAVVIAGAEEQYAPELELAAA